MHPDSASADRGASTLMDLTLERLFSGSGGTLGVLFLDGKAECFTLEDEFRIVKVQGETRIPSGRYRLRLRALGESPHFDERYATAFANGFHRGMVEITAVPGFTDILIHTGNTSADTRGCLLVGETANSCALALAGSRDAYRPLYSKLSAALSGGGDVWLTVLDRDR
jgi:hypothetical protein